MTRMLTQSSVLYSHGNDSSDVCCENGADSTHFLPQAFLNFQKTSRHGSGPGGRLPGQAYGNRILEKREGRQLAPDQFSADHYLFSEGAVAGAAASFFSTRCTAVRAASSSLPNCPV